MSNRSMAEPYVAASCQQLSRSENITREQLYWGGNHCEKERNELEDHEEVWGLPDTVVAEKKGSDIIDRLTEKRRKGHSQTIGQMQTELSTISKEFESLFKQYGEEVLLRLFEYDDSIEKCLKDIEGTSDLMAQGLQDMHDIWNRVFQESSSKRKCIKEADSVWSGYETERKAMISASLKNCATNLKRVGYWLPCDVQRFIDNEAMKVNQALLANQRALAKLNLNLREKHLQMEFFHRLKWEEKMEEWKKIKLHDSIDLFKKFINSPQIQKPENFLNTLSILKSEQTAQQEKRAQTLEIVADVMPPNISKASVAEWYLSFYAINEEIDGFHVATVKKLQQDHQNNWQECLAKVDNFKSAVSGYGFTSEEIQQIVTLEILPLIGNCQSQKEEYLRTLDEAFENLAKNTSDHSKCLSMFLCGAAQLWEIHCLDLERRNTQLENMLNLITQHHDHQKQKNEDHLDVMLDKLRQESSKEALKSSLEKILVYLEQFKIGYMEAFQEKVEAVERYPSLVFQDLQAYSFSLSQFFGVEEVYGQDPMEFSNICRSLEPDPSLVTRISERTKKEVTEESAEASFLENQDGSTFDCYCEMENCVSHLDRETFTTEMGNVFYCHDFQTAHDHLMSKEKQPPDLEEAEPAVFPTALAVQMLNQIKYIFLHHLKERFHLILTNAITDVEVKKGKIKTEMDLCLRLHVPRSKMIETDVHNVRAAELVLHQECVDRHCKGVLVGLENCQTDSMDLQTHQNNLVEVFESQILSAEKSFTDATKSEKIVQLHALQQTHLEKLNVTIQKLQREYREKIDRQIDSLREANSQIMRSFKLFSEAGNFSHEEIKVFQSDLDKMDKQIDSAEGKFNQDIEKRQSKCFDQAKKVFKKFEEKVNYILLDLKFLEKIKKTFTNTQLQIKTEAFKSNEHKRKIDNMLRCLEELIDAENQDQHEKMDIPSLSASLIEETKKRCQYLECLMDPSLAPLQGAFAVAARPKSQKQDKMRSTNDEVLLKPSRIGVPFQDDVVVGVIKDLLLVGKPKNLQDVKTDTTEKFQDEQISLPSSKSGTRPSQSISTASLDVFGSKSAEQNDSVSFKASITRILSQANRILLMLAEEFYKKKDRHSLLGPPQLQETLEECEKEVTKRLLIYQSHSHKYLSNCLQELQIQLTVFDESSSRIPQKVIPEFKDQSVEELTQKLKRIEHQSELVQKEHEHKKNDHCDQLRVLLSAPAREKDMKHLMFAEQKRHKEQIKGIQATRQEIQECVHKTADEFVKALAKLAEQLLIQFDNLITINDLQLELFPDVKLKMEMSRKKQTHPEDSDSSGSQKSNRTWPGICYFAITDKMSVDKLAKKTVTITTVKSTDRHICTVEERNAAHQEYWQRASEEVTRLEQMCKHQEQELQAWNQHWESQIKPPQSSPTSE